MYTHEFLVLRTVTLPVHMIACWQTTQACTECIIIVFHWANLNAPVTILVGPTRRPFSRVSWYGSFSHVRSPMSIDQSLLLIIQKLTNINVAESFTSMCFESKKWVSSTLVPCILELHLELRRFGSMGKSWNTKYRGASVVIVPYIRDNSVCTG